MRGVEGEVRKRRLLLRRGRQLQKLRKDSEKNETIRITSQEVKEIETVGAKDRIR